VSNIEKKIIMKVGRGGAKGKGRDIKSKTLS